MKTQTMVIAGAAIAAGILLVRAMVNRQAGVSTTNVPATYGIYGKQAQITQAAIAKNWAELEQGIFKSQPDFWV